jgi:hypothetical protein
MGVNDDRYSRTVSEWPVEVSHSAPETRRPWVVPTWERLETPMEVTMYAGRR